MLTTGNLTNAFAQSVAVVRSGADGVARSRLERMGADALALAVALAVAYLSHTGTLAILFVATLATARICSAWRGGPPLTLAGARPIARRDARRGGRSRSSSTTRISWTPTAPSSRASATRRRPRHPTRAAARSAIGCGSCPYSVEHLHRRAGPALRDSRRARLDAPARPRSADAGRSAAGCCRALVFLVDRHPDAGRHALLPGRGAGARRSPPDYGAAWAWSERLAARTVAGASRRPCFLAGTISTAFHNWWNALG